MSISARQQDQTSRAEGVAARIGRDGYGTVPVEQSAPAVASISQQRLWFLNQFQTGRSLWTVVRAVRMRGKLDTARLEQAINSLPHRHAMLRTALTPADGLVRQEFVAPQRITLGTTDLTREE